MEPRKRKRLLLAFAGIVAFVAGLLLVLNRNTEPTYNGRPLSEWVVISSRMNPVTYTTSEKEAAANAIRAIGTNALPYLVEWLGYETKALKRFVWENYHRIPKRFQTNPAVFFAFHEPEIRMVGAAEAFEVLGPVASAAISPLTAMLQSTNTPGWKRHQVFSTLAHLGPAALPVMRETISNYDQNWGLVNALSAVPPDVIREVSTEILTQAAGTNTPFALGLSQWLRNTWVIPAEEVVPVFAKCLADPRPQVRIEASVGLWFRARYAKPVLPALLQALDDPDPVVRSNVFNVLQRIAPDRLPRRPPP